MSKTEAAMGRKYTDAEKAELKARYEAATSEPSRKLETPSATGGYVSRDPAAYAKPAEEKRTIFRTATDENGQHHGMKLDGSPSHAADMFDYYAYRHPGWHDQEYVDKYRADIGGPLYQKKDWADPVMNYQTPDGQTHYVAKAQDLDTDAHAAIITHEDAARMKSQAFYPDQSRIVPPGVVATEDGTYSKTAPNAVYPDRTIPAGAYATENAVWTMDGKWPAQTPNAPIQGAFTDGLPKHGIGEAIVTKKKVK